MVGAARGLTATTLSLLVVVAGRPQPTTSAAQPAADVEPSAYEALRYRPIGPQRGGRATTVSGVAGDPYTYYMGTSSGGLWKTTSAGSSWFNISDGYFDGSSIGCMAIAPSDQSIIFVGTGEAYVRTSIQEGTGVYRSLDAGRSWRRLGFEHSGQIAQIQIHPRDPRLVFVAVLGRIFSPNADRGVYRSADGGASWERVLHLSDRIGAVDLSLDLNNPQVLFAAMYPYEVPGPWSLASGGEGGGLFRTTDGGQSWTRLEKGLPRGLTGRIGVSVSPADSQRVYALFEAAEGGGVFRSDDGGNSFNRTNRERKLITRIHSFGHIWADPVDADTVYVGNVRLFRSIDGGFRFDPQDVVHPDHRDLWVNPRDTKNRILANDGGATITFDDGPSWTTQMNQPTAEFYNVTTDTHFPYRVYGAQHDNSTISVSSRPQPAGWWGDFPDGYSVGGGEQGDIRVDPRDPDIVYAGDYEGIIERYDHRSRQARNIETYPQVGEGVPPEDLRYRFRVQAPIRISRHEPGVIYHASQYVHRSTDQGQSWRLISPDLTRNDKTKQRSSGGPIDQDNVGVETYGAIKALEESPQQPGVLWVGTDDGRVQLSRDGGAHWEDITPKHLPDWATVNMIELSAHNPARALVAAYRYQLDDDRPYVFRTNDYGRSWDLVTQGNGIPPGHFVRVVREDRLREGLLWAGTERGMYVSFDDGEHWQPFQLNLPIVPISDMVIHEDDLVISTYGRAFWILDDISPLRQIQRGAAGNRSVLYQPRDAYRPLGARLYFHLPNVPSEPVLIQIRDSEGRAVRTFNGRAVPARGSAPTLSEDEFTPTKGMNRIDWDVRYAAANAVPGAFWFGDNIGPLAVPGPYEVRLTVRSHSQSRTLRVTPDPRVSASAQDYDAQLALAIEIRDQITAIFDGVRLIRTLRSQLDDHAAQARAAGVGGDLPLQAESLTRNLMALEQRLMQTRNEDPLDTTNFPPQLDGQYVRLLNVVLGADARPTAGTLERKSDLDRELAARLRELRQLVTAELAAYNERARAQDVPAIMVPASK